MTSWAVIYTSVSKSDSTGSCIKCKIMQNIWKTNSDFQDNYSYHKLKQHIQAFLPQHLHGSESPFKNTVLKNVKSICFHFQLIVIILCWGKGMITYTAAFKLVVGLKSEKSAHFNWHMGTYFFKIFSLNVYSLVNLCLHSRNRSIGSKIQIWILLVAPGCDLMPDLMELWKKCNKTRSVCQQHPKDPIRVPPIPTPQCDHPPYLNTMF